jgi:transcriptional regulator with XRE-family HTH domain
MNRQLATRLNAATEPYSYREMAVRTGCHPESIRRWLRGEGGDLPAHFLVAACRAFQISPHWLLTGEGTPSATHTSNKLLGTCAVSELFAEIVIRLQRAEAAGQPQSLGVAEVRTISQLSDPVRSAGSMANSTTKSSSRAEGQP